ncbi:hypothetical protein EDD37DRAFT_615922 [Exophiala viscosa]|uniref:G-patch domain-containing protein n=1 Tax=Exophiala viscosa TaxID=2486360 RepID=A0AAN6IAT3_9EURO|nr:hypothetical protein EDD36DRAFT_443528 [Exophiala viscosa]KAI1629050.1 hypothetical protein EDD37DRAFT_615922 [Exophiala viscosa]
MDAHAHLLSLGWAGPGHSLDSQPYKQKGHRGLAYDPAKVGNNGVGLVKPLLVSQRKGRLGIGKKAHEPQAGNEWWLKGFESALGNIGKTESERSSGTSTPVVHEYTTRKHSGLYTFFIKGQQMEGTLGKLEELKRSSTKRKSDVFETDDGVSSKKKKQKTDPATEFETVGEYIALRDKDEKRRDRTEKPSPVEEFKQVSEYLEARSDKKKRKRNSEVQDAETSTPVIEDQHGETKEQRRERRRKRKEEKERQRQEEGGQVADSTETEDAAVKAARRAERKKRKAEKAAKQ